MIWPPLKAWTSIFPIDGHVHFVAINYGGKYSKIWVILMSVLDSSVVVKVSQEQLFDPSIWMCGWDEKNDSIPYEFADNKDELGNTNFTKPSMDSGLTIPITKNSIRPWFSNI